MIHFIQADARYLPLADNSVHCVVTSPPYWGLRDYRVAGQIGLEPTLAEYLRVMVGVFAEVHRVLRPDGTCWINMGDGYAANRKASDGDKSTLSRQAEDAKRRRNNPRFRERSMPGGLKVKDLLMQPHRLAIALQEAGWYVRSDCVWHKPNPMPESVSDRPTKSHEYVFLLSKSERYFYDAEAVREATTGNAHAQGDGVNPKAKTPGKNSRLYVDRDPAHKAIKARKNESFSAAVNGPVSSRNLRTVWTMATRPCNEAHFATFPIDLPRRCILAGTSAMGCCPACGSPWKRVVEKYDTGARQKAADGWDTGAGGHGTVHRAGRQAGQAVMASRTTHWLPTCRCSSLPTAHCPLPTIPATVFDPFGGAGTTGLAAMELGRSCVLVERKMEYIEIARARQAAFVPNKKPKRRRRAVKPEPTLFVG